MYRSLAVLVLALCVSTGQSQDKDKKTDAKDEDVTERFAWKMDYLETAWGLKFKSARVEGKGDKQTLSILLTFTKDADDVKKLQETFYPPPLPKKGAIPVPPIQFYFFDKDDTVIGKTSVYFTRGEITGVKGDAFRVVLQFASAFADQGVKKIAVRPSEKKAK